MERKKTLFERVRKNSTVDEEVENEGEEEDESGVNITEEEKKKKSSLQSFDFSTILYITKEGL